MRKTILSLMLVVGCCCMVACLGGLGSDQEEEADAPPPPAVNNAQAQAEPEVDPRHLQRINGEVNSPDEPLDFSDDVIRGTEPQAKTAAEHFVNSFIRQKQKLRVQFPASIVEYDREVHEWAVQGVIKNKSRTQAYTVDCYVQLTDVPDWECRRIMIDGRREYTYASELPGIELPNVLVSDKGVLQGLSSGDEIAADDEAELETEPEEDKGEKEAASKLKMAKQFLNRKPDTAKERLEAIISDYPETQAAEEAKGLLENIR